MKPPRGATAVIVCFGYDVFIESKSPYDPCEWSVWDVRSDVPRLVEGRLTYKSACAIARRLAKAFEGKT